MAVNMKIGVPGPFWGSGPPLGPPRGGGPGGVRGPIYEGFEHENRGPGGPFGGHFGSKRALFDGF